MEVYDARSKYFGLFLGGMLSIIHASYGLHECSCWQYGQRAMRIASDINLKPFGSISMPVEKLRSDMGHRSISTAMETSR